MKINEIYYDDRRKRQAFAYRADEPVGTYYNTETSKPMGRGGEWLIAAGAQRSDIKPAMEKARLSPEYEKLIGLGFKDKTTKRDSTNGSFWFEAARGALLGLDDEQPDASYRVLLYGRISGHTQQGVQYKMTSAEPATKVTHPDLSPVDRLVLNYTRAFARLYKDQAPKFEKAVMAKLKD